MTKEEKRAYMLKYNARYRNDPKVKEREAARRAKPEHKRRWQLQAKARRADPAWRARLRAQHDTIHGRFSWYRAGAKQRGISFDLTFEQFSIFWKKPCTYCGAEIKTVGIDRVDNSIGYIFSNAASCCSLCNFIKRDLPKDVFVEHCRAIVARADFGDLL